MTVPLPASTLPAPHRSSTPEPTASQTSNAAPSSSANVTVLRAPLEEGVEEEEEEEAMGKESMGPAARGEG